MRVAACDRGDTHSAALDVAASAAGGVGGGGGGLRLVGHALERGSAARATRGCAATPSRPLFRGCSRTPRPTATPGAAPAWGPISGAKEGPRGDERASYPCRAAPAPLPQPRRASSSRPPAGASRLRWPLLARVVCDARTRGGNTTAGVTTTGTALHPVLATPSRFPCTLSVSPFASVCPCVVVTGRHGAGVGVSGAAPRAADA